MIDVGTQTALPFSALVGFGLARRALLCALVDPELGGVVVHGPSGVGKSELLRSFSTFVSRHIDPLAPIIRLPAGVDREGLHGGVDLARALAGEQSATQPGLIERARGGLLIAEALNALEPWALHPLSQIPGDGSLTLLIGETGGTGETLPHWFIDRIPFHPFEPPRLEEMLVPAMLSRRRELADNPEKLYERFEREDHLAAARLIEAREWLLKIIVGERILREVMNRCGNLNVEGDRAPLLALRAARAHAALRGSRIIESNDLDFAVVTVLAVRTRTGGDTSESTGHSAPVPSPLRASPEPGVVHEQRESTGAGDGMIDTSEESGSGGGTNDDEGAMAGAGDGGDDGATRVIAGVDFNAMPGELGEILARVRSEQQMGEHATRNNWRHGRHVRAVAGLPQGRCLALAATLRAAAPHQHARRGENRERVVLRRDDLRVQQLRERTGTLYILLVDASGSMAANRMNEAKGAVARLLHEAYVDRDSVALIAVRGAEADLLLPPTRSVARARRALETLPTGGGTPLASALLTAMHLALLERVRAHRESLIVLLTDGRANIPVASNTAGMIRSVRRRHVREELEGIAARYRAAHISSIVIDTRTTLSAGSEAASLARMLDARYCRLPHPGSGSIVAALRSN